jgi:phytoene dehydrogenase-like protein
VGHQTNSVATVDVAIIGAGPAGLTAGYLLAKAGKSVLVAEKDPHYVGGISMSATSAAFRHRAFKLHMSVSWLRARKLPRVRLILAAFRALA